MISQAELGQFYIQACEADVLAFKPGNVSVYSEGHDMTVDDFKRSAEVSSVEITRPDFSLGEKIYYAVAATREAVGCNTNLGIILLSAPVCHAAYQYSGGSFRRSIEQVLESTTIEDAEWAFKAIDLASPGGIGEAASQDVRDKPSINLTEAMQLASHKDRVARQYSTVFKDIYDFAILRYNKESVRLKDDIWPLVSVYSGLLTRFPDSHIERKYGEQYTHWVHEKMQEVDEAIQKADQPETLVDFLHEIDRAFKLRDINPGTTADLTVATVLINLMEAFSVRCTS